MPGVCGTALVSQGEHEAGPAGSDELLLSEVASIDQLAQMLT